jgi:WD40 repeat protein
MRACMPDRPPQVFAGHQGRVTSGDFTPDGKAIFSTGGEDDCSLRAWNPKTGECTATIQGHGFHEAGEEEGEG